MDKLVVRKSGPLHGEVLISGAKNSVLKLMAASILAEDVCVIENVPNLQDVRVMAEILVALGMGVEWTKRNEMTITPAKELKTEPPYELVQRMRASIVTMGPLLGRTGQARLAQPGGCAIGERKIDLHLKGFAALGVDVKQTHGCVEGYAEKLVGDTIYLDFPSVGATENIMMAAVLAEGVTTIENAAKEPELTDLANFLNKLGANVKGAGTDTIRIKGVESLGGTRHMVLPDRIEAGTYMVAAAVAGGDVMVKNVMPNHLKAVVAKLQEAGCEVDVFDEDIHVKSSGQLNAIDIKTLPFPGFPTDMQAQFMALSSVAEGVGTITETIFENRFMHATEFSLMGAQIKVEGHSAIIQGGSALEGANVKATDLRAGAALVIAALVADGPTTIHNIYHIDRGYDLFEEKLRGIGVNIERVGS
ncbi:UDP-N-acetylglucosamine 1-carboxyvinyltransferase [Acidaminobacter sp. JC074]|uniref:UDP-N-acetylglucosamine 1-carboxyvinyltransferase n=1 Tax=Acidaminobacter sp. JC074 TaxID=2530199 RepID=UPI001F0CF37F|nr:UDP-N-acetylglucosamine 1-carboxyvinyltransferase [Acidaminobacter sp. JC074]MCH4889326.1 UDP-N-acetylglucosamine 1-carboxyvinyltransferase [Acidaminobacter sp. JC074]